MNLSQPTRISSLLKRIPRELLSTNQGALYIATSRTMATSEAGSGAGKGGGSGGSIREAGGSMGKRGAAQEDQYFNKQSRDLKDKLKEHLKDELKKHEDAIKATKELMKEIDKDK
uniref:ATPase inhibitor, mitochondrial n=1 Tax=Aceria tosichella TaxID=561515 RepID=A0A6G1SM30_9ACAR